MTARSTAGPAIRVQGLGKSFGKLEVLRGVDFDVVGGSIFALLGSNGAGKTTVVRILSTLLKADSGTASVNGFDVAAQPANVRESLSLTGQFAAVDDILSGRENLVLVAKLQGTRKRLARLAAGEHLALPQCVVDYLDRLRGLGVHERYIEMERDAWIMVAAQVPHLIDSVIAQKHKQLDHPDMVKLYSFLSGPLDWRADDPRIVEIADILERMRIRAVEAGEVGADGFDDQFAELLDATVVESSPGARRVVAILEERDWKGWTRIERVPADRLNGRPPESGGLPTPQS
jgi:ABC-type sugar transport system ATPase subunit